jgi:uncharacterized protein YndB with AHSA1/START domain
MKPLVFSILIHAGKQKVWNTILGSQTYREWVNAGWPGAYADGKWAQGENIRFLSPGGGGTLAHIAEFRPYEYILADHTAVINSDGTEDFIGEQAKGWIGSTEAYSFKEKNGKTELSVEVHTAPEWEEMFSQGWPEALAKLKDVCEL